MRFQSLIYNPVNLLLVKISSHLTTKWEKKRLHKHVGMNREREDGADSCRDERNVTSVHTFRTISSPVFFFVTWHVVNVIFSHVSVRKSFHILLTFIVSGLFSDCSLRSCLPWILPLRLQTAGGVLSSLQTVLRADKTLVSLGKSDYLLTCSSKQATPWTLRNWHFPGHFRYNLEVFNGQFPGHFTKHFGTN